jgi:hypothetical protein
MAGGYGYGRHLRQEHWKGKKKWINCLECQIYYTMWCSVILYSWKIYNKHMDGILQWILIIIAISIPSLIAALFNYFLNKKKVKAETESIQLKNKITEDITYDQLKSESKHKDIKNKIEIFQNLTKLEEEIKNKGNITSNDQKKLESLEMIKKEFKQSFAKENEEKLQLADKKQNLETKRKKTTRKALRGTKTSLKKGKKKED